MFTTFRSRTQMLYALALALDGPALAKLLHPELAALLVASLVALAGRAGRTAALFAVLCLLADPLFVFETTVVYTDLPLALVATLAAQAAIEWDREGRRHVALRAALLCGLAAGIRYQGALVGLALAVALALAGRQAWRRRLLVGGGLLLGTLALLAPGWRATSSPRGRSSASPPSTPSSCARCRPSTARWGWGAGCSTCSWRRGTWSGAALPAPTSAASVSGSGRSPCSRSWSGWPRRAADRRSACCC